MTNKKYDKAQTIDSNDGNEFKDEKIKTEDVKKQSANKTEETSDPKTDEKCERQEISETDFLNMCLEKSMQEINRLKDELENQKKETDNSNAQALSYKEKLSSLNSEYENFRRRTAQEKEGMFSDAVVKSVAAILPGLDSLERAINFAQLNPESLKQGVEMTLKQLTDGFKNLGVTKIEAQGAVFDPALHNAVVHVSDENSGNSIVTEVFQKGYVIGDKVIRHSVVKVAN